MNHKVKPVLCTCNRRFKTNDAMLQHQRDSPRHTESSTPQVPQRTLNPQELLQRLSLQDEETDHCFIPFSGGEQTKKRKTGKGNIQQMGLGGDWKIYPNTGQMMNFLEDQDWALCDKDCGWCGHCNDGGRY